MKKFLAILCVTLSSFINLQAEEPEASVIQLQAVTISAASQPLVESEVFRLINEKRAANLLPPLRWASSPAHEARQHSLKMAKGIVPFGHDGVQQRFDTLRVKIPSLTLFGENVAYNLRFPNPAQAAVDAWMASPGHYANIMGDFNLAGLGVAQNANGEFYFTQIFVKATIAQLNALEGNEEDVIEGESSCLLDLSVQVENE